MELLTFKFNTVEGDYINIIKTTSDVNFDLFQALKQHGKHTQKYGNKEKMSIKKGYF